LAAVRVRDLGIHIGAGRPGAANAITDVVGVRVGHTTLIEGDDVRTGVTVIVPGEANPGRQPLFAGCHRINGNGELTGLEWVRESGLLTSPVAITNTFSVGVVRDALIAEGVTLGLPVVGETYDGSLNDIEGMHVRSQHLHEALACAAGGRVAEGNVGGGTGMICHGFKGGIGTSSRVIAESAGGYTVGVLVQANYGRRRRLRVDGLPVGEVLDASRIPVPEETPAGDSIIIVVATDAPLLPHQCERLARRAGFGVARTGGVGEHSSGDLVVAFATGNRGLQTGEDGPANALEISIRMLSDAYINALYDAVIDASEEAILNALLAATTMTGRGGVTAHALEPAALQEAMAVLGRAAR
jgi:D-aminopeptidase